MIPIKSNSNRRVLIVGAKFGEIYINAFLQPQPGLELAGLFARGSRRAQQLAHDFGIPLYTSMEQLPDDIDIACVVVRSTIAEGEGSRIAEALLQRGVHVIQEHPMHPDDVERLQQLAQERGLNYWVNSFYPHVAAGRFWVDRARRICRLQGNKGPCSGHLNSSRQLLYSMLDLLLQACGLIHGESISLTVDDGDNYFVPIRLHLPDGASVTLRLQSYLDPSDPDMFSLVMHQASLVWPAGYLTLEASYGPVVWTGLFHDSQHGQQDCTLYRNRKTGDCYDQPTSVVLQTAPDSWRDAVEIDAPAGVAKTLKAMSLVLDGGEVPAAFGMEHQLALAKLWLNILQSAPEVEERPQLLPSLVAIKHLQDEKDEFAEVGHG